MKSTSLMINPKAATMSSVKLINPILKPAVLVALEVTRRSEIIS